MTMAYQVAMQEAQRRGPWLEEEDKQLIAVVALLGERRWEAIARASGDYSLGNEVENKLCSVSKDNKFAN